MRIQTKSVGLLSGPLAVAVFLILYSVAMSLDPGYVFGENYLSDLGVSEGAWAFNSGVIIAGLLFLPFAFLGVRPGLGPSRTDSAAVGLMMVAGMFLVSIGIFTEDSGDLHGIVSYGFFLTMLVVLGLLGYCFDKSGPAGRPRAVITLVAFVMGLSLLPLGGTPLVETIAVLSILVWGLVVGLLLLLKR